METKRGFGTIELLVAVTLVTVVMSAALSVSNSALEARAQGMQNAQATLLLTQGAEAMRLIRDSGWATTSALTLNQTYYPFYDGVMWKLLNATSSMVDGTFDWRIRLNSVQRDAGKRIVTSGGTVDPDAKLVTVTVAWKGRNGTTTRMLPIYLINIFQ